MPHFVIKEESLRRLLLRSHWPGSASQVPRCIGTGLVLFNEIIVLLEKGEEGRAVV